MNTPKTTTDMAALAAEVCDLWQDHLATLANDPTAKAELARMLEPQRQLFSRLFADYATMMQHSVHGKTHSTHPPATTGTNAPTPRATPTAAASDDSALRLAQFAHRVAALEERIAQLESSTKRGSKGSS